MSLLGFTSTLNMRNEKIAQNSVSHQRAASSWSGGLLRRYFFRDTEKQMSLLGFTSTLNMRNEKIAQNSVSTNAQLHHDPGGYCDFIFFEKLRNGCHFWGSQALSICGMKRSRKIASPPTRSFIMIRGIIATLFFSRNWEMDVTLFFRETEKWMSLLGFTSTLNMRNEKISQNSVSTNSQLHHDPGGLLRLYFFRETEK